MTLVPAVFAAGASFAGGAHPSAEPASHVALGAPGFRDTPSGARERWASGSIVVELDPSLDDAGEGARDAVESAFGTWLGSVDGLPDVTFNRATESGGVAEDGVNRVVLAPIRIPGHENDVAVTIGYADSTNGHLAEADIILNSRYVFGNAHGDDSDDTGDEEHPAHCASKRYDVQSIVTHEAGHFFGLGEDLSDSKATMFIRSAPCETHKRGLTAGDQAAMSDLYARASGAPAAAPSAPADPNAPVVAPAACSVDGAPARQGSDVWASAGGLLVALGLLARLGRRVS